MPFRVQQYRKSQPGACLGDERRLAGGVLPCDHEGQLFLFSTNHGLSDRVDKTAVDQQVSIALGVYNETGIIVGYGNLDYPATFYAYDSQCPNCYGDTGLPRYSLSMDTDGTAECGSCHRKYDMSNQGLVVNGDAGRGMMRYHATVTGGVLNVNN